MDKQQFIERYWRDATPADAIKEPPMVARFRDDNGGEWKWNGRLLGIDRSVISGCLWCAKNAAFRYCQVYDAPDPGEGWRLIDPNTETLQEGDGLTVSSHRESGWVEIQVRPNSWSERDFYRRRIEQPKPEPRYEPFKWEDREQLRGRWIGSNDGRWERFIAYIYKDSERFYANGISTESLLEEYHFLDTGEPVGRRVE